MTVVCVLCCDLRGTHNGMQCAKCNQKLALALPQPKGPEYQPHRCSAVEDTVCADSVTKTLYMAHVTGRIKQPWDVPPKLTVRDGPECYYFRFVELLGSSSRRGCWHVCGGSASTGKEFSVQRCLMQPGTGQ